MKLMENNTLLKLVSLLIAVALWLYVGTEKDPLSQKTYEVAVEMQNLPVDKTATLSQETVEVRVMGRQDRLNMLNGDDFKAYVDLKDAEEGSEHVPVQLTLPSEVYFARVEPRTVDVQVEQREGKTMNVDVVSEGTLPEGISIDEINVEPQSVFVTGDPSAFANVARVGVVVDQSTVLEDSKEKVNLHFYDASGAELDASNLDALPSSVTLSIKVEETEVQKEVPIQAHLVGTLPENAQLQSVSVSPETVSVTGSPKELAALSAVQTETIDLSSLSLADGAGEQTLQFNVGLVGEQTMTPQSVTVTLVVSKSDDSSQDGEQPANGVVDVPLTVSGQAAGLVTIDTQTIEISYHMLDGYADAGASLAAYVNLDTVPDAATTVSVQLTNVPGLVVDAITPSIVTVYPNQ